MVLHEVGGAASAADPMASFHEAAHAASVSDPHFCAPVDDRTDIEFVLGVISSETSHRKNTGAAWRTSVRQSFFRFSDRLPTTIFKIVLRGINASRAVRDEARMHNDTIFLPSSASLAAARGPLTSTLQWFACAAHAWPHSLFIGKAEDDTWLHVPEVLASLRASHRELIVHYNVTNLFWGALESYYWNETAQRPFGFSQRQSWNPNQLFEAACILDARGNASRSTGVIHMHPSAVHHGPFAFAKGPLYALSRALAQRLSSDPPTLARAAAALETAGTRRYGGHGGVAPNAETFVWEDVWIGYALSRLEAPAPDVGVISLSFSQYVEEWGFTASPATLIWHAKTKDPSRPPRLHTHLASGGHCTRRPNSRPRCRRADDTLRGGSCAGGRWVFCSEDKERGCSDARIDFNKALKS